MKEREGRAAWVVAATIAFACFALGSAPRWAAVITAFLCVGCAVPLVRSRRLPVERPVLILFLGLATGFTLIQVVPLPAFLARLVASSTYQLSAENAAALGQAPPAWAMLSLDPPATLVELAKLVGYTLFAWTCLRIAEGRRGRRRLLEIVALAAGGMAAVAFAHYAIGATSLFGVYEPRMASPKLLAPLLNDNHFAGLMAFAAPIAVGLAVTTRSRMRGVYAVIVFCCIGATFLAGSRAAVVSLVLGMGIAVVLMVGARNRPLRPIRKPPRSKSIAMGVVAFCGLILLGSLTAGGVMKEISATRAGEISAKKSKFGAWRSAVHLLKYQRWTGVGRGAFEPAFTRFHDSGEKTFSHLENEYLQAAVDWGIPASGALAIALILVIIAALRRANASPLAAGAFAGLTGLGLQNTIDFGLQLPGVALPAIAALATLTHVELIARSKSNNKRVRTHRIVALCIGAALIALAASPLGRTAREDAAIVTEALKSGDREAVALARRAFDRHPADYIAAAQLAQGLFRTRDSRAVSVLNRALYLHPTHSGVHHLAAQMLAQSQQAEQSLVEYSLALRHARAVKPILQELTSRFPDPTRSIQGIPVLPARMRIYVRELRAIGRPEVALAYMKRVVSGHPDHPTALDLLWKLADEAGRPSEALEAATKLFSVKPTHETAHKLVSTQRRLGRHAQAVDVLRRALGGGIPNVPATEKAKLLVSLSDSLAASGDHAGARAPIVEAIGLVASRSHASALHRKLAAIEQRLGNTRAAELERARARQLSD